MSVHQDVLVERTLELLTKDGTALGSVDEAYRRDPDLVLAAVADCPEALRHAAPELLQEASFLMEVVNREWRAFAKLPPQFQKEASIALQALRKSKEAMQLLPASLRSNGSFMEQVASLPTAPLVYEGEALRLVGYCNKWKLTEAACRFQRHPAPGSLCKKGMRHCLSVKLQEGPLSFQVISCTRNFGLRIFPKTPGKDGFFRLVSGNPMAVCAVAGGEGDGHGRNFFIQEAPNTLVTIHVEVVEGSLEDIRVWYEHGRAFVGKQRLVPVLSQAPGRQKPKKDMSPVRPAPKKAAKEEVVCAAPAAAVAPPVPAAVEEEKITLLPDVGNKAEYADLVLAARSLSKKTFDHRFYLRDLAGKKHLTLIVNDAGKAGMTFLGYCLCDGLMQERAVWIEHLAVEKKVRRQGLGKQLVRWAGMWALAGGCEALRLSALPTAVPFYEALGFEMLGEKDKDMHKMELQLSKARGLLWGGQ